jgi:hypothetical protein
VLLPLCCGAAKTVRVAIGAMPNSVATISTKVSSRFIKFPRPVSVSGFHSFSLGVRRVVAVKNREIVP